MGSIGSDLVVGQISTLVVLQQIAGLAKEPGQADPGQLLTTTNLAEPRSARRQQAEGSQESLCACLVLFEDVLAVLLRLFVLCGSDARTCLPETGLDRSHQTEVAFTAHVDVVQAVVVAFLKLQITSDQSQERVRR